MEKYKEQFEQNIKNQCHKLTPSQRKTTIIVLFFLFFFLFAGMFTAAIYNIGVHAGKTETGHIKPLPLNRNANIYNYGK